ncbi:hypothetical protein [Deinococcus koreensis]|uniref:hypothetical protein n=1 Tax=Deinococcus koreensis TaxID=2054903 RepID=UPI0010573A16|nr:hypothetical protein [Deinococcus koreensis]
MLNALKSQNISIQDAISSSHFGEILRDDKLNGSQISAVKYFYGEYFKYNIENLMQNPILVIDELYRIAHNDENIPPFASSESIYAALGEGRITTRDIETYFQLPKGCLSNLNISQGIQIAIGADWWPDEIPDSSPYWQTVRESIRYKWEGEVFERSDLDPKQLFLSICEDVISNDSYILKSGRWRKFFNEEGISKISLSDSVFYDFNHMSEYKDGIGEQQPRDGWGDRKDRKRNTLLSYRSMCSAYYKYLIHEGLIIDDKNLSLALFGVPAYLLKYIDKRIAITGGAGQGVDGVLRFALSLCRKEVGWLRNSELSYSILPEHVKDEIESVGGWDKYLDLSLERYSGYLRKQIRRNKRAITNHKEKYSTILKLDNPIEPVWNAIAVAYQDIQSLRSNPIAYARELEPIILIVILASFPLRSINLSLMTCSQALNRKHIRVDASGEISLHIPVHEMKNRRNSKALADEEEIIFPLTSDERASSYKDTIVEYLKIYRPLLTNTVYVFPTTTGLQPSTTYIQNLTEAWTKKYLSSDSIYPSRIPGLPPMKPHMFRKLIATQCINDGNPEEAEVRLVDSASTVRDHYVRNNINLRIRRLMDKRRTSIKA